LHESFIENNHCYARGDKYPVNKGHVLIIPKRHVDTWFEMTKEEQHDALLLLDEVRELLDKELSPNGYNIGFNCGVAAGQTVMHAHIHVIPRYKNDIDDPTGGVRGVIPSKQKY
jgi:diadenosine tetraphosphate (Ap4A) HIT family hydrolase